SDRVCLVLLVREPLKAGHRRASRLVARRVERQCARSASHELIRSLHDGRTGAIVPLEPKLSRIRMLGRETEQIRTARPSEAVNSLTRITDHTQVVAIAEPHPQ